MYPSFRQAGRALSANWIHFAGTCVEFPRRCSHGGGVMGVWLQVADQIFKQKHPLGTQSENRSRLLP